MSGKRYKITFHKPGIQFEHKYATSVAGAVRTAASKGFNDGTHKTYGTPKYALIYERFGSSWEQVAAVTGYGELGITPFEELASVKDIRSKIKSLENSLEKAAAAFESFKKEKTVYEFLGAVE